MVGDVAGTCAVFGLPFKHVLPHTDERTQQEIRLYLSLGTPLIALKGYAAQEVEHAFTQVQNLCEQGRNTQYLVSALLGLGATYLNRAEFHTAQELAERVLRQPSEAKEPTHALWAYILLGHAMIHTGEFASAQSHFTQGITLYNVQRHNPRTSDIAQDPGVHCRSYLAEILWWRGYPDQARQSCHEALTQARRLSHPYSRAITLASASILHNWLREQDTAQEFSQELIALATEQGFPHWLAVGLLRHGWTLAEQGKAAEGVEQMRQGFTVFQSIGAKLSLSVFLCELAWAQGRAGQLDEGLALLAEAQMIIDKTGERLYEVELYRMKGELTLQKANQKSKDKSRKSKILNPQSQILDLHSEAEVCFHKAIKVARRQQAKSLELRAATSLARLWQQQGKRAEAHCMLSEIYQWFTEGFETTDLQEAKALLNELQ